jgi:hypothetical protein
VQVKVGGSKETFCGINKKYLVEGEKARRAL